MNSDESYSRVFPSDSEDRRRSCQISNRNQLQKERKKYARKIKAPRLQKPHASLSVYKKSEFFINMSCTLYLQRTDKGIVTRKADIHMFYLLQKVAAILILMSNTSCKLYSTGIIKQNLRAKF